MGFLGRAFVPQHSRSAVCVGHSKHYNATNNCERTSTHKSPSLGVEPDMAAQTSAQMKVASVEKAVDRTEHIW